MFSLICVWINRWVNNRDAGDLRRHRGHYDVSVMSSDVHLLIPDVAVQEPITIRKSAQSNYTRNFFTIKQKLLAFNRIDIIECMWIVWSEFIICNGLKLAYPCLAMVLSPLNLKEDDPRRSYGLRFDVFFVAWASYQIRQIAGCTCAGNAGNVFPATDFKGNRQLTIPACITAREYGSNFTIIWSWWRHQMETFSALLATCVGNSPVSGEFPTQRPVTQSFDVLFDLRLNQRLSKQSWGWWFETL